MIGKLIELTDKILYNATPKLLDFDRLKQTSFRECCLAVTQNNPFAILFFFQLLLTLQYNPKV